MRIFLPTEEMLRADDPRLSQGIDLTPIGIKFSVSYNSGKYADSRYHHGHRIRTVFPAAAPRHRADR
jgi:hypothetical protein